MSVCKFAKLNIVVPIIMIKIRINWKQFKTIFGFVLHSDSVLTYKEFLAFEFSLNYDWILNAFGSGDPERY